MQARQLAWALLAIAGHAHADSGTVSSSHQAHLHMGLKLHSDGSLNLTTLQQRAQAAASEPPEDAEEQAGFPVLVVSMRGPTERRAAMKERLEGAGVSYAFMDAVESRQQVSPEQMLGEWAGLPQSWEGSKPQRPQPFNLSVPYKCHATTTPSQMACLLSHLFTIFSAWQAGLEEVLVLEDDMEVLRMPTRGVLGSAPEGWGALQLYMLGRIADELYNSPPAAWVPWRPGLFNTGAYLINAAGMRRVLETYLPGAVESGTLMAAQLNATSVHESQCVADWMVYKASQTYASTDFWFVEEAKTSSIEQGALGIHHTSKANVLSLLAKHGFRANYTT